jgi:hypothetical protein
VTKMLRAGSISEQEKVWQKLVEISGATLD